MHDPLVEAVMEKKARAQAQELPIIDDSTDGLPVCICGIIMEPLESYDRETLRKIIYSFWREGVIS